jgi:hypothetical protein
MSRPTRISDWCGIGLALILAGVIGCVLKWVGFPGLRDEPWWEVLLAPAFGFLTELVVLFVWLFSCAMSKEQ